MDQVVHAGVSTKILVLLYVLREAEIADLQELAVGPDHTKRIQDAAPSDASPQMLVVILDGHSGAE
jgi:hypothetical protein